MAQSCLCCVPSACPGYERNQEHCSFLAGWTLGEAPPPHCSGPASSLQMHLTQCCTIHWSWGWGKGEVGAIDLSAQETPSSLYQMCPVPDPSYLQRPEHEEHNVPGPSDGSDGHRLCGIHK